MYNYIHDELKELQEELTVLRTYLQETGIDPDKILHERLPPKKIRYSSRIVSKPEFADQCMEMLNRAFNDELDWL